MAKTMVFWEIEKIPGHRQWFIQSACATTGDGLYEAGGWSWRRDLDTRPKINMELENWWIVLLFSGEYFQVPC